MLHLSLFIDVFTTFTPLKEGFQDTYLTKLIWFLVTLLRLKHGKAGGIFVCVTPWLRF